MAAYRLRNGDYHLTLADWFRGTKQKGGEGLTSGGLVPAFSLNSPDAGGSRQKTSQLRQPLPLTLTLHGVCFRRGPTENPYPGHRLSQTPVDVRAFPICRIPGVGGPSPKSKPWAVAIEAQPISGLRHTS
jgi:hypothetical protein